jgi:signal transduction histidine kinase/ActR/RegA family two-component response regulator
LYDEAGFMLDEVDRFIGGALEAGNSAVVIATEPHRAGLLRRLEGRGLDMAVLAGQGRYRSVDAAQTLSQFMIDGWPDERRFADAVGGTIAAGAGDHSTPVRAFGEMVLLLWAQGARDAAIRVEELWNELSKTHAFSLVCAYAMSVFRGDEHGVEFRRVCDEHTHVIPAESFAALIRPDERNRAIAALQQKAQALDELLVVAERARADAETAKRARDEFLGMLGHELRNPLSAMRNALVTARLDPARRERAVDIASRQSEQLARLVDDLLDVARITQGKITLRTQKACFASIVERAVETARPLIEERAHHLTLSLPGNDVLVDGDCARLEQVIVNLLHNAAKYTPPGGTIDVAARCEADEIVLRVRDDGVGISPDLRPRVFDLFAQSERDLNRPQGGLGIGLTVVRRLVELHGGRVEVHSDGIDRGAEFVVRLPVPAAAGAEPDAAAPLSVGGRTANVLVVEDNVDTAESLMMLLEVLGHRVRVAHDGVDALGAARQQPPDVMLVDIGLPGMDGYEVARCIRQQPELSAVVLVALTGYGREEDKQCALAAGFDHHLVKPVELDALRRLVTQVGTLGSTAPLDTAGVPPSDEPLP